MNKKEKIWFMSKNIVMVILVLFQLQNAKAQIKLYSSSPDQQWHIQDLAFTSSKNRTYELVIDPGNSYQTIQGWGGCFNEKGWKALTYLPGEERMEVIRLLFDSQDGCGFNYCRMPIGASDYALDYYSLNDTPGDYAMENFSIDRDRKYLLPYIKAAMAVQPGLQVWGSPWTPPAWMKKNKRYNKGELTWTPQNLNAYALYFQKYVEVYRNEGVRITAVHVQNEPLNLPAFPSCGWSGIQMGEFVRDYLGPRFETENIDCEIWLGTINGNEDIDEFKEFIKPSFSDPNTAKYLEGAGFQWYGDAAVEATIENYPDKAIMQTETKCGWGGNDWEYAFETYDQMQWYLERNSIYYLQWNMILDETGMSSWGWKQNSMITIDTYEKKVKVNPQYWIVRHFSQFVTPGSTRIGCRATGEVDGLAFRDPRGNIIVVITNQEVSSKKSRLKVGEKDLSLSLGPMSINTVVIPK